MYTVRQLINELLKYDPDLEVGGIGFVDELIEIDKVYLEVGEEETFVAIETDLA